MPKEITFALLSFGIDLEYFSLLEPASKLFFSMILEERI
jgi:hypothetical protein